MNTKPFEKFSITTFTNENPTITNENPTITNSIPTYTNSTPTYTNKNNLVYNVLVTPVHMDLDPDSIALPEPIITPAKKRAKGRKCRQGKRLKRLLIS